MIFETEGNNRKTAPLIIAKILMIRAQRRMEPIISNDLIA
jgi:hypothetical protein